jgi:hypothetical protein
MLLQTPTRTLDRTLHDLFTSWYPAPPPARCRDPGSERLRRDSGRQAATPPERAIVLCSVLAGFCSGGLGSPGRACETQRQRTGAPYTRPIPRMRQPRHHLCTSVAIRPSGARPASAPVHHSRPRPTDQNGQPIRSSFRCHRMPGKGRPWPPRRAPAIFQTEVRLPPCR